MEIKRKRSVKQVLREFWVLYLFFIPVLVYLLVYRYYPILTQAVLAFKKYRMADGIWGSPWAGLEVFKELVQSFDFYTILYNTLFISVMRLVLGFFPPIIMAILLFDLSSQKVRKTLQTFYYIPFFLSWVVIYSLTFYLFSNSGLINQFLGNVFGVKPIQFMLNNVSFYAILFGTDIWKNVGYGIILYTAALGRIDGSLLEAAKIDGANPWQRIKNILIPGIQPIVVFLLMLNIGLMLRNTGTEQVLLFYSPATYQIADMIDTWVYRQSLLQLNYELGAALGFCQSAIGFMLIVSVNQISKKVVGIGIW